MRRAARNRVTGAAAGLALLTLVAGTPAILISVAGWPLPSTIPEWERVRRAVTQGDIPADTAVVALAVIVWLVWLQVAWALVWEVAVNLPRLANGHRPRPAPLVASPVGTGIGRLLAMALAIGTVVAATPAPVTALPATPSGAFMPAPPRVEQLSPARQAAVVDDATAAPHWIVAHGDSLWRIAEIALGDGERAAEILEHNRWLGSPRHVSAGQILTLPADATVPADRQQPATPSDAVAPDGYLAAVDVVVAPGDTLWSLAEQRLATVDDDVTDGETLRYVDDVIAANPDVVEDPNLIFPGEIFTLPALGTPPPPAVATAESDTEAAPTPQATTPLPPLTPAVPDRLTPSATHTTTTAASVSAALAPTITALGGPVHAAPDSESSTTAPWLAGISGATALASGLLLAYRRRITARAARGAATYRAGPVDPDVLTAITRASDVSLLRWANAALADLTAELAPADVDGQPLAIELSETVGIDMLWTQRNPNAREPWRSVSDGWAWQLAYDADQPVDNADRPAAIPALVTIGRCDGNQLLLNLEAVGTLAVDGDDQPAADFVRSLVTELANGEILTDAFLVTTGITLDTAVANGRVRRQHRDEAHAILTAAVDASRAFLRDQSLPTAFAARLHGDATGRETTVVAVDDDYATPLHDRVDPGLAACLLYTGAPADGPCVRISRNGIAILEPYGIEFEPVALPVTTTASVDALFEHVTDAPASGDDEDIAATPPPISGDIVEELTNDLDDDWRMPDPAVLVRVLGAPEVVGHALGRIETSIVAYLACHGGRRRDEQIINAVWNGRAVETKTLWNRISKIRATLGPDLVPTRMPNSSNVLLSDGVMTDLGVLSALTQRADDVSESEALALLLQGLDLIDGVPFDSAEYEWAFETQDHATACEAVEAATLRCVDIAMHLGDLTAARHAVTQGLRALPLNEPLYRARMRIEAASGNVDGVRHALRELAAGLQGAEGEPQPGSETVQLARELLPAS